MSADNTHPKTTDSGSAEPHGSWIAANSEVLDSLSYDERDWLLEYGSLTAKIEQLSGRPLQLDLLTEDRGTITKGEATRLGLQDTEVARIREVVLHGCSSADDISDHRSTRGSTQPWIFARTVIPPATAEHLAKLGNKPLGHFLFTQPGMERPILEVCRLSQHNESTKSLRTKVDRVVANNRGARRNIHEQELWARRSLWRWQANQMLVMEVFLADCPIYSSANLAGSTSNGPGHG